MCGYSAHGTGPTHGTRLTHGTGLTRGTRPTHGTDPTRGTGPSAAHASSSAAAAAAGRPGPPGPHHPAPPPASHTHPVSRSQSELCRYSPTHTHVSSHLCSSQSLHQKMNPSQILGKKISNVFRELVTAAICTPTSYTSYRLQLSLCMHHLWIASNGSWG